MKSAKGSARTLLFGSWLVLACSSRGAASLLPLEGGSYRLECKSSLSECLARAEATCDISGYRVLSAAETKQRVGVPLVESERSESRAIFICGGAGAELDGVAVPEPAASPSTSAAPNTCFPGASQACVGPGGCSGGHYCLPDGKALSACDCGPPAPAAPASPASTGTPAQPAARDLGSTNEPKSLSQ